MMTEHYIEEDNLSLAWGKALRVVTGRGRNEVAPLIVSVTDFGEDGSPYEDAAIRNELDGLLTRKNKASIETVANTIFPNSLWNPETCRKHLFSRYSRIWSRIKHASSQNKYGTYFERMISNGPPDGKENQLEFAISTYLGRTGVRRSVLQVGIFDPHQDHSAAAMRGFPCLQHVTFAPTVIEKNVHGLSVNALYATQYIVKRAYGNYLGLCRLGHFVAHELGIELVRVTCHAGIAQCDMNKTDLKPIIKTIKAATRHQQSKE